VSQLIVYRDWSEACTVCLLTFVARLLRSSKGLHKHSVMATTCCNADKPH